ncbi:MAG: NAD(P)/FAD-dependent oxidoreductase [Candidatus Heimdallarchaeaceae archaeon]
MKNKLITKVALIGGGPACATAAIQLIRSGIDIVLVSKEIGGTIKNANLIENLLGYPEGVVGKNLAKSFQLQLAKAGVPIILEEVLAVEKLSSNYLIRTAESEIISEYLIVGTGSVPKKLKIEGEKEAFQNDKLFYEVFNVKKHVKNKDVIIIGSGDVAYDYALNLQTTAKEIFILHRTEKTTSLPILQKRVQEKENIKVLRNNVLREIDIQDAKITVNVEDDDKTITMLKDIVLVAIGREPNFSFLSKNLISEYREPVADSKIYFIGDVKQGNFRQVSIAMGDGMKVAMEIVKEVTHEERYHGTSREIW